MIKRLKQDDYFKTADLALAAAINLFIPLEAVDKVNPNKALFIFLQTQQTLEIIESFWKRQLQVEPLSYFNSLRTLKARLYER